MKKTTAIVLAFLACGCASGSPSPSLDLNAESGKPDIEIATIYLGGDGYGGAVVDIVDLQFDPAMIRLSIVPQMQNIPSSRNSAFASTRPEDSILSLDLAN